MRKPHYRMSEAGLCIHCGAHPSYLGPCPKPPRDAAPSIAKDALRELAKPDVPTEAAKKADEEGQ